VVLLDEGESILALTLPGRGVSIGRYLRSRVFFMDKVTMEDASVANAQVDVWGPVEGPLERLGASAPIDANAVAPGRDGLRVVRLDAGFGLGYRLVAPAGRLDEVEALLAAGGLTPVSEQTYALRRLEAGLPSQNEWNEDYTPLETGLRMAVADAKGCYTGQEVIARQITYDKVTRRLCGLRLDASSDAPAELVAENGAAAGRLTSLAKSPRLGVIGRGVIRRPHDRAGALLWVGGAASGCRAEVVDLPFD